MLRESILGILEALGSGAEETTPEAEYCRVCRQVYKGAKDCGACTRTIEVREHGRHGTGTHPDPRRRR